ncbi:uncharacterized protein K441DRAFT_581770 [Cenococcum geophilum 1.58]|uniref:uncharacterized protein n=1 Tax=Cenococcum geophilum 1.58 TaxID=794803 RepID=UPI00358E3ECC|nr:hypothetical protein K441DRAFT_581770 [Cenococcum geophilum 1.58]
MAEDSELIIVGIDLGLTYTGVAFYPSGDDTTTVAVISEWPGSTDRIVKKVPTALYYSAGNRRPKKWGFECPPPGSTEHGMMVKDRFKLYLVEEFFQKTLGGLGDHAPGNFEDVQMWFVDFLTALYKEIKKCISEKLELDDWRAARVEYLFSVPTTWDNHPEVLEMFKAIAAKAGFGESEEHSVQISLSEAEAAAVYTAASQRNRHLVGVPAKSASLADDLSRLRQGDTVLVCDAGGGTTDVAVLKVSSIKRFVGPEGEEEITELGQLDCVDDLNRSYSNADAKIRDGRMVFSLEEIRSMFDTQITEIFKLIDKQLENLKAGHPSEVVSHFVISGGLGSSQYVQDRIKEHYEYDPHGKKIKILISTHPQLVVCKGLVLDRLLRLKYQISILPIVYCSASYGIIVNELYNKRKHDNQRRLEKHENKVDGKWYAVGQIYWLITKGTPISRHEPVNHMFRRITNVNTPELTWKDAVAISKLDPNRLPQNIYEGDAKKLCEITSLLNVRALGPNSEGVRRRRRPVWKTPREYFEIEQKVLVNIGSVDLKFAVQFQETIIGTQDAIPARLMHMDNHRGREDDFEEGQQVDGVDDSWQHGLFAS